MSTKKYKNILAFCSTLLYGILLFLLFNIGYETNDDAAMQLMAQGIASGHPSPFLIYIGLPIGKVLQYLYNHFNQINWYYFFLISFNFISIFFIIRLLLFFENLMYAMSLVGIFLIFTTTIMVHIQFTSSSLLLGVAAFLQMFHAYKYNAKSEFFIGTILLTVGSFLRFDMVYVFIAMALPLLFLQAKAWRFNVIVICLITILYVEKEIEMNIYSKKTGMDFRKYLYAQDVILDNPTKNLESFIHRQSWSSNDLNLLVSWFFIDKDVFNPEKIIQFSHHVASSASKPLFLTRMHDLMYYKKEYLCLVFLLFLILFVKQKTLRYQLVVHFLSFWVIFLLMAFKFRMQDRVVIPILIFSLCYHSYLFLQSNINLNKIIFSFALSLTLYSSYWLYMKDRYHSDINKDKIKALENYLSVLQKYPDKVFVIADATFPLEGCAGMKNFKALQNIQLMGAGWSTFSPVYNERLKNMDIKNLMSGLVENEDLVTYAPHKGFREMICTFYKEHYNQVIGYEDIDDSFGGLCQFSLQEEMEK